MKDEFDRVIATTLRRLPDWAREKLSDVAIRVLDDVDPSFDEHGQDLLGLYVGIPLTERDSGHAGELPDVIYIFRNPHYALGLPRDALYEEIHCTLIHEIAHYFGIDDDRLDELGWG